MTKVELTPSFPTRDAARIFGMLVYSELLKKRIVPSTAQAQKKGDTSYVVTLSFPRFYIKRIVYQVVAEAQKQAVKRTTSPSSKRYRIKSKERDHSASSSP